MRCLFTLLFCLINVMLFAQTFTGKVKNKEGEPLVGASVVALAERNSTIAYCITNDKGEYKLTGLKDKTPLNISIRYLGYGGKTISFSEFKDGMTIILSEGGFKLKEVTVKQQRIQSLGDTITYSVASFKQGQSRSIADVISKMPGLEVKSDGKIEYQGKAINKFYIEGLDLMGSHYGVANKNISADKVQSVQVLENHQSVKSLRGISFSDQAALNIVLKDDAKAVWIGTTDLGSGYGNDFLYDCRIMGMKFNKKYQSLMMYKSNNTGQMLGEEILDLTSLLKGRNSESGILNMMEAGSPDLTQNRYTFNNSHLLATNCLWKIGEDSEIRLQGNGLFDKSKMQSHKSSTYLTIADLPIIVEDQNITNTYNEYKGELNYQYNGANTYIKNNMKGYIDFNKSVGDLLYNDQHNEIKTKPRKQLLSNDFQLSHTNSKGDVYNVDSYLVYNYLPGQLLTIDRRTEQLNLEFFTAQNYLQYKQKLGKHYLNNDIGVEYNNQRIKVYVNDDTEQDNAYKLSCVYWQPSMSFLFGKHHLDIISKFIYARQSYKQSKSNHFWIDPSLKWNWKASVISAFSANIRFTNSPLMGKAIYDTPLFTDYRTIKKNKGVTDVQHILSVSANYKYSNPVTGLFFNVSPNFIITTGNILYKSNLKDRILYLTATEQDYKMQTRGLSARISKSFGWAKTLVGIGASHKVTDYSLLISDKINDARMNNTYIGFDYSLRPLKQISIEGKSETNIYKQQNLTHNNFSSGTVVNWEHSLNFHIFPTNKWMFSVQNELFHTNEDGVDMNYFLDIALSYKAKRWELAFKANNIIGNSLFERRTLGNTIESYSLTWLRPREFLITWSFDI